MLPVDAERLVLTTPAGHRLLEMVAAISKPTPADIDRWRRSFPPDVVSAAIRLVSSRRRAFTKFRLADRMWLEPEGVEQATAEAVATHKACRFQSFDLVVDLCSGLGGDALAIASAGPRVIAVDADPAMPLRLRWNAEVHGLADRLLPCLARAESLPVRPGFAVHVDPDRRASPGAGRAHRLDSYAPGLPFLQSLFRNPSIPGGAIKLGPASDFDHQFDGAEVELISLNGECKEATVWFGRLASCRRRATILPSGATWTDHEAPNAILPTGPLSDWIFDPDPSLIRSGLLPGFAAAHGLHAVSPGVAYLTGPSPVDSPFLRRYRVLESLPFDLKHLRHRVHDLGLGPLEIKVRGLDTRPEDLRKRLDPPGPTPATLLLLGGTSRALAVLAERVLPPAPA